jgi:hypothetical protein
MQQREGPAGALVFGSNQDGAASLRSARLLVPHRAPRG